MKVNPPTPAFAWSTLTFDVSKALGFLNSCRQKGCRYGLGAKVAHHGDIPKLVDCSGFVREAVYQATGGAVDLPDGSVNQHQALELAGFKHSTPSAGALHDGAVRIAFLSPHDGGGTGHVALVYLGQTMESHGGIGPDRREWTGSGWQGEATVYVLTAPTQ